MTFRKADILPTSLPMTGQTRSQNRSLLVYELQQTDRMMGHRLSGAALFNYFKHLIYMPKIDLFVQNRF